MQARDRYILIGLAVVAMLAGFWFMGISPQREKAAELDDEITGLQASIDQQKQVAAFASQARDNFPKYYGKLVVLGKAVPEDADTASMLVELSDIASDSDLGFNWIKLAPGGAGAASAATPPAATPPATSSTDTSTTSNDSSTSSTDPAAPASASTTASAPTATGTPLPTEATAASLPIGAAVGPAGLPTLPYELSFSGRFFDMADFFRGLDGLTTANGKKVAADGRLMTIDGFALFADEEIGFPFLEANLAITTYSTPASQGLTAGATPTAPPATVPPPVGTPTPTATGVTP